MARRIIPADAGSTTIISGPATYSRDHPRGCGEHKFSLIHSALPFGSSPRMRGAPSLQSLTAPSIGIIPADAGSTISCIVLCIWLKDHPRGCGEHVALSARVIHWQGSSPRMRGAPVSACMRVTFTGIIPADAGSTRLPLMDICPDRDHPRGCGEHIQGSHAGDSRGGSSPRMRGAPAMPHL